MILLESGLLVIVLITVAVLVVARFGPKDAAQIQAQNRTRENALLFRAHKLMTQVRSDPGHYLDPALEKQMEGLVSDIEELWEE